jgi:protein-tyrosine phosphatase
VAKLRICFVCLGNICRSPTAEGVMQKLISDAGLGDRIEVDSAGTAGYHSGEQADRRARAAARARGIELTSRARQFKKEDWDRFDYVLAMDRDNHSDLEARAPAAVRAKLFLLREFDPRQSPDLDVPDPYYGGSAGFEKVLDICDAACRGFLAHLCREHEL